MNKKILGLSAIMLLALPMHAQDFPGAASIQGQIDAVLGQAKGIGTQTKTPSVPSTPAPGQAQFPVRGIDISHFEGAIDWGVIKTQGLSFVFIKATEGDDLVDQDFQANWKGASSAGLAKGAYHFYNFCKKGADQADNFIKTVPVDDSALAPTVDIEQSGDCKTLPAKAAFRKELAAFTKKIKTAYGKTPILYVNAKMYAAYFQGESDPNPIWLSDPRGTPVLPGSKAWTFWQYAFTGRVNGIATNVDMDVFDGTPLALAALGRTDGIMLASAGTP
jgi:lysozyme